MGFKCEKCKDRGWLPVEGENRAIECECATLAWFRMFSLGKFHPLTDQTIQAIASVVASLNTSLQTKFAASIVTRLHADGWVKPTMVFGASEQRAKIQALLCLYSHIRFKISPSATDMKSLVDVWVNDSQSFAATFKSKVCTLTMGTEVANRGAAWTLAAAVEFSNTKTCSLFVFPSFQNVDALIDHYDKIGDGELKPVIPLFDIISLGAAPAKVQKGAILPPPPAVK